MYIGLIAAIAIVVIFIVGSAAIWLTNNFYRVLRSLFTDTPFQRYTLDDLADDLKLGESSQPSRRSQSNYASGHPLLSNPDSIDPRMKDHLEKTLPYLHLTDQYDEYMEGGWWKADPTKDMWKK